MTALAREPWELDQAREFARDCQIDPRVSALVPGFDAPFFQAGLAGYSDGAMRLIARQHGCPYCVTEALLDRTLLSGGKGRRQEDPDLLKEECGLGDPEENRLAGLDDHPIAGQIMGTDPDEMARAAALMVQMGYDMVDVNLACPVKKIRKRRRGGHFLAAPDAAIDILRAVREAVPAHVACSVKLRRGFDDTPQMSQAFYQIFEFAYAHEYAWATVHARTVEQKYHGPSRWPFLEQLVREYPDRLIFGSGDVWRAEDIFLMLARTGVHAASVARGCIGNPWLFRQARALMAGQAAMAPTVAEQRQVLSEHYRLAKVIHGERKVGRSMRKFGIRFSAHHPDGDTVRKAFIRCSNTQDWHQVLEQHYRACADPPLAGLAG